MDVALQSAIQYGCFGLLAALVVWSIWKGIPGALTIHRETMFKIAEEHSNAIAKLVESYEKEAEECREERLQNSRDFSVEREKDRQLRAETNTILQRIVDNTK